MTLPEMIPEINRNQWSYLYTVLDESLELTFVQKDKLEKLLGFRITL